MGSAIPAVSLLIEIALFLALTFIGTLVVKMFYRSDSRLLNLEEYLPKEEIHNLTQLFFLGLMAACFINIMYTLIYVNVDTIYFALLDVFLSLYIAVTIDKSTAIRKLVVLLLVPCGALHFLLFNSHLVGILDLIHVVVFFYFMKHYYDRFMDYTDSNGLGISIILLFIIIFVSFIITTVAENVNPLDSIVMVTNAFTSNGYAALGETDTGKINSMILAWSGIIIPSVATATLAASIMTRHFKSKLREYDEKLDEINNKMEDLEDLIKRNFNE